MYSINIIISISTVSSSAIRHVPMVTLSSHSLEHFEAQHSSTNINNTNDDTNTITNNE